MPRARILPPWKVNPKIAARNARLRRLQRKGLTPAGDKDTLRKIAADALAGRIPMKRAVDHIERALNTYVLDEQER